MDLYRQLDLYQAAINERRPFSGELLNQIRDYYRIGLTWSSNALEGNTLTESETKVLIEDGLTVGGKSLIYTFEALGHAKAYDFMFTLLHNETLSEPEILTMHRLFYYGVEQACAGKYRTIEVVITGSKYPVTEPERIPTEMVELLSWAAHERELLHPVIFAAQMHKRLVFIHPFKDGNGRIARLVMNAALIQKGFMPAVIPPVLRHEYIELLEKSHRNDKPFERFIAERVFESQKEIMRLLHIPIPRIGK